MTKADFVTAIAEKTGFSKKDTEEFIKAYTEIIIEEVKKGEKLTIPGLGTFSRKDSQEREGVNPITKEKIKIAARKSLKFTPAAGNKNL